MKKIYKKGICGLLSVCLFAAAFQYRNSRLQQNIAEKILRFHVLANSDTVEDQQLKLKVRDCIGTYLQVKLRDADTLDACMEIVEKEKDAIENCAEEVIAQEGYNYPVKASLTKAEFPVKSYGMFRFPAGNYQALRVTIGEGKGQNWWCVMYPNMCFSGSVYEVVEDDAKRELESVLTEDEYQEIMAEGKIHVKFRYFEENFLKNK